MHRFHVPSLGLADHEHGTAMLDAAQSHHARHVLRLKPGDQVELFDGHGATCKATIERWSIGPGHTAELAMTGLDHEHPLQPAIDVAAALPKGPRAADLVNSLSQLGADRIIPLRCQRSAIDPNRINRQRLQRAAIEAAKQCRRAHLLKVDQPQTVVQVLAEPLEAGLLATPKAQRRTLPPLMTSARRIVVLIGPEGGFTDQETDEALGGGCIAWNMGPQIMRIETACAAAVAILRYLAPAV